MINYASHCIDEEEISAVVKVLRSDYLTQGKTVEAFEDAICQFIGCKHAIVVNSGTSALHLAVKILGKHYRNPKQGKIVTTPLTFVATVNAITNNGFTPMLQDIDKETLQMIPYKSNWKLDDEPTQGQIIVHYGGVPNFPVKDYHGWIIEDAAHSFGIDRLIPEKKGTINGFEMVGANPYCQFTCFSFHAIKSITTGEGGALVTQDADLALQARTLRDHGRLDGLCIEPSENYRMTDFQAAMGIEQLKKVGHFLCRRHDIATIYMLNLKELLDKIDIPEIYYATGKNAWHLYPIRLKKHNNRQVMEEMRLHGVNCQINYIPVYRHPAYCWLPNTPNMQEIESRILSLPIHYKMTNNDIFAVVRALQKVLK